MKTKSGQKPCQNEWELTRFLRFAEGATSYLEIGARFGDTLWDVMRKMAPGARGVVVEMQGGLWGRKGSEKHLERCVADLTALGYDMHLIWGDSTTGKVINAVKDLGPYDLALIDGDHRYYGCMADWLNYGPMADAVAFHDIVGHGQRATPDAYVEVPQVWKEIKNGRSLEIVAPNSRMGIGVMLQK